MGFKSMTEYNDQKYGNWFRLQNDGDYADVIFLYRGKEDAMMADTHYIKSDVYSGYVTCCGGRDCPACMKQIRIQPKLFIPLYVIDNSTGTMVNRVQFWDRTMRFQPQLVNDVFRGYANPSEYIFRITRHGMPNDINTTYDIRAIANNKDPKLSYDAICSELGIVFPDYYNTICREVTQFELSDMMSSIGSPGGYSGSSGYGGGYSGGYGAVPRGGAAPSPAGTIPGTNIPYSTPNAPNLSMPSVPIQAPVPSVAPDPNDLPFGSIDTPRVEEKDPLETNEDVDVTNLVF